MRTTAMRDAILDIYESTGATLTAAAHYVGLFTALTDFRAGTVTEANYTGYSATRPGLTLGAMTVTSPVGGRQRANDVAITYGQNTGTTQDVIGWFVTTVASGAGTVRNIGLLDAVKPIWAVGNDTATELLTAPAHGISLNQRVFVLAAPGALLPAGLSENTAYFAVTILTDTLALSLTSSGAAVDITAKGAIMLLPYTARTVAVGASPEIAIGALVMQD